jgi:hypothetical protein
MAEHKDPQNFCNRPPPDLLNIATISTTAKQLAHAKLELEAPTRKFKRKRDDEGSGGQPPSPPGGGDEGGLGGQGGCSQGPSRGGNKGGKGEPTSVGTDAEFRVDQGGPSDASDAAPADGEHDDLSLTPRARASDISSGGSTFLHSGSNSAQSEGISEAEDEIMDDHRSSRLESDGWMIDDDEEPMDEEDREMYELIKHVKIFPWTSLVFTKPTLVRQNPSGEMVSPPFGSSH